MESEHTREEKPGITRKTLFKAALIATPVPLLIGQVPALARDAAGTGQTLTPTPYCDDGDDPTPPQIEGPYFKPNSPQRSVLPGAGTTLTLSGYVFGLSCQPLANVLLDFWQADSNGAYDNVTYNFRGHQYTNAQGAYKLTTIVPGLYPGRTRHIHVKVQAPNQPILTTQLYFPGEPRNSTDTIFDPALLMTVRTVGTGREATFDFVLNVKGGPPTSPPPGGGTWQAGVTYQAGDQVTYGGATYRCLQGHLSQAGWEPPNVPALWQRV
ncbi:carbohydrate-binding protein [Nonomuraea pusilla]|uniref:Protocatechuate 3,4-dioxygenase beta subunit n=1 Tax=Nonomuraea pusilla TaxID=46177 RepID=A0A1H7ZBY4_9ACTN|nr:carbohydrate-binding protein [Nonomuraea pusilla]SEM55920.1 Protocatechuate 3,4-dioxygenase beta subunit [Nonomuraea pusilla]